MAYHLPILTYHRIVDNTCKTGKHNIYLSAERFRQQLEYLKNNYYQTITFKELLNHKSNETLEKKVILTFDDGYTDNYTVLFPILKEYRFTAVIFLVTGLTRNEWGMKEGEPELTLLSHEMIGEMRDYGIEFGSHTQQHIDLSKAKLPELEKEIGGSKTDVEKIAGITPLSFAYPFGGLNEQVKQVVKKNGYHFGIATKSGPFNWNEDLMQVRRIEITNKTGLYSFKKKVSGSYLQKKWWQQLLP